MKIDYATLQSLVDQGLLTKRKHPEANLYIYNYTQKCQFDKCWTEETMMCRGLITDGWGNIIARPFRKFFNLEEHEGMELPEGSFEVYEKMDGSLGILYWIDDQPWIATRGSFESDQAIKGTEMIRKLLAGRILPKNLTFLFEIIYPDNRIVVDYGEEEKLVLLAIIDTETGKDLPLDDYGFETVKRYDGITDLQKIKELAEDNKEGFVIKWSNGFRIKVKFDEYVRLHRLLTGLTARRIWGLLRNRESIQPLLERVPEEFVKWVNEITENLSKQFEEIHQRATTAIDSHNYLSLSRKEAAIHVIQSYRDISSIIFNKIDNKPVEGAIWKMLKPKHEIPLK